MHTAMTVRVIQVLEKAEGYLKLKTDGGAGKAYLFLTSFPPVAAGDYVKVNTTADTLQLGTGGWDVVISTNSTKYVVPGPGHIMKARYTPFQHSVFSVDDPDHPDHNIFQQSFSLEHVPILLAELHSMLPILLGAVQMSDDVIKVGVVLSDEASLPAGFSDHMTEWKRCTNIHVVTAGQAYGGNEEAVNMLNAVQWLTLKKKVDLLVLSMGPGTVGTNTPYGFSGIAQAEWANMTGSLKGVPFWVPRLSFETSRKRHYGISHHTTTPLYLFTYTRSILVLPVLEKQKRVHVKKQLHTFGENTHVTIMEEDVDSQLQTWLAWYKREKRRLTSMDTEVTSDPDFLKGVLAPLVYIMKKREERINGL
ncbi:DUF3866 family protein [Salibacterium sp. K-3]